MASPRDPQLRARVRNIVRRAHPTSEVGGDHTSGVRASADCHGEVTDSRKSPSVECTPSSVVLEPSQPGIGIQRRLEERKLLLSQSQHRGSQLQPSQMSHLGYPNRQLRRGPPPPPLAHTHRTPMSRTPGRCTLTTIGTPPSTHAGGFYPHDDCNR